MEATTTYYPGEQVTRPRITEVRISRHDHPKLKAFVTITLDNCFVIRGLKIIQGIRGMLVAMPCRRRPDGSFQDLAHPIDNATRREMERIILDAYFSDGGTADALVPAPVPDGPHYLQAAAYRVPEGPFASA